MPITVHIVRYTATFRNTGQASICCDMLHFLHGGVRLRNNSNSIKIPDFTVGSWKTNKPNMDINMENGGGTTKVLG